MAQRRLEPPRRRRARDDAPAPHQPVVADDAVIVAGAARVGDRAGVAHRVEQPFAERRRHRHIGRDRQHGRGDRRIDRRRCRSLPASTTWRARTMPCGVCDALAHAGRIDRERGRVLEDARAVLLGVGREAERIVERMDVERLREMQRLEILRAAQHLAHLIGRPGLHVGAEIDAQHGGMLDHRLLVVDAPHREAAVARLHAAASRLGGARVRIRRPPRTGPTVPWRAAGRRGRRSRRSARQIPARRTRHCARTRRPQRVALPAPRPTSRAAPASRATVRPASPAPIDADIDVEVVVERGPLRRRDHGRRIPGRAVGAWSPFGHRPLMPRRQGSRKPALFPCRI